MIDVHAHFADEGYEFPAEWEKIKAAGVRTVILAADTLEHALWHAKFCNEHEGAYFTVGIHPEFASSVSVGAPPTPLWAAGTAAKPVAFSDAPVAARSQSTGLLSRSVPLHPSLKGGGGKTPTYCPPPASGGGVGEGIRPSPFTQSTLDSFEGLAAEKKCVAVGEIGLDYHYEGFDKTAQRKLFEAQLMMAEELDLPVQIHSRDACADTLDILRAHYGRMKQGFLMHCYSYGAENLKEFLELGAYFSFGGVTCFKNARRVLESVRACPTDRILSETDSPYLSPFRGEKNTPANIPVIVEKLAEIKDVSFYDMLETIRENAKRLFDVE